MYENESHMSQIAESSRFFLFWISNKLENK